MALAQGNFSPPRGDAKRGYVQEMFTAIAPRYDFLNHALSLNIDRSWRRQAVRALEWKAVPEGTYLDLCAGTLDLAAELSHQPGFQGTVIGADFVVPMLRLGASKGNQLNPVGADALGLPFPDASFDGCAVAFGARNLADLGEGLEEMARVIKPGGRLVVLEFTTPSFAPMRALYLGYFRLILPMVGRLISRHKTAYSYLPNSVLEFPEPAAFGELISQSGFDAVSWSTVTFGIAAIHVGTRT